MPDVEVELCEDCKGQLVPGEEVAHFVNHATPQIRPILRQFADMNQEQRSQVVAAMALVQDLIHD